MYNSTQTMDTSDSNPNKKKQKWIHEIQDGRKIMRRCMSFKYPSLSSAEAPTSIINILFVHGSCAGSIQFESLISSLDQSFLNSKTSTTEIDDESKIESHNMTLNCYLFDALGCGDSKPNVFDWHFYSEQALAKDLENIFSHMCQEEKKEDETKTKTFIVAHSYGTSQVIKLINNLNSPENHIPLDGIALIGSALGDGPCKTAINGGLSIFKLPVFILKWMQTTMTNSFVEAAYHGDSHQSLKETARTFCNQNDMAIVKAFYRQTKWVVSKDTKNIKVSLRHTDIL